MQGISTLCLEKPKAYTRKKKKEWVNVILAWKELMKIIVFRDIGYKYLQEDIRIE